MSYIRFGSRLPSGKASNAYVIGDDSRLVSGGADMDSVFIPYPEKREIFRTKTQAKIKAIIMERLDIEEEETEVVCRRLFEEDERGEWNKPFEF